MLGVLAPVQDQALRPGRQLLVLGVLAPVQDQFWAKSMAGCAELPEHLSNKLGRPKW